MSRYNRCKECYNMECIFVTGEREDIDTSECADFRPMTNADRIRTMSDEELATWLNCMQSNAYHCGEFGRTNAAYPFDNKAWLEWLKAEVSE